MDLRPRREAMRAILAGRQCVHPASVYDPISGRLAEEAGFEMVMVAGSTASLAVLAAPDLTVLTLSELAEQCHRINRVITLPMLVDADHGYGNALNVKRTIEELESAGVAAATIEDTLLPAPFGGDDKALISKEEGIGKIKAALAGRQDPTFSVIARTSAAAVTGMDDCLDRCRAYVAAGADGVFLSGIKTAAEAERACSELGVPVILGSAGKGVGDRESLGRIGVRVALQGHITFLAAAGAMRRALRALRDGVPPSEIEGLADKETVGIVNHVADYKAWTKQFLS